MEKYIQPFVEVCQSVFKDFLSTTLTVDRPHFIDRGKEHDWDISAVIGLTGETRGAVVISMKQELAFRLTAQLTGGSYTEMDEEVVDAIGEIINIIAGNAKRGLEESFQLVISLPSIIRGSNHTITWPTDKARILCIPFRLDDGSSFCLSVALDVPKGE